MFTGLISTQVSELKESKITNVADAARDDPGVIKLWIGEGDLATPNFIRDAAVTAIDRGATRYTYALGLPGLREALSAYHRRHWKVLVDPERFSVTVGGMNALMQACQAILEPQDEVVVPSPGWPNLFEAVRIVGGRPVTVPFQVEGNGRFSLPLDSLFAAVSSRTRAILINSPSNPTGWIMPKEDMIELLRFVRERNLWLISDEVYNHFVFGDAVAHSFLEFAEPDDNLIITNTFSKNWAMTGWRAGWVIFPLGMAKIFDNLSQYNTTGIPTFIQHAAIAALNDGDDFIKSFVVRCAESRKVFCDILGNCPGVRTFPPDGTFYLLIAPEGSADSLSVAIDLLRRERVGVAPGVAFGAGGEPYLRICFAVAPSLAEEAAGRIARFFGDSRPEVRRAER